MYRQLQNRVREYIVEDLCKISKDWMVDIDMGNEVMPLIVGNGPDGESFKVPIEEIHLCDIIKEHMDSDIRGHYDLSNGNFYWGGGIYMVYHYVDPVFKVYNVEVNHLGKFDRLLKIMNKNKTYWVENYFTGNKNTKCTLDYNIDWLVGDFTLPLSNEEGWVDYQDLGIIITDEMLSPLVMLLDPIKYFRVYSEISKTCEVLNNPNVFEAYKLLLGYFPEMDDELFAKYLIVCNMFQDWCGDIVSVVLRILVDLMD